MEPGRWARITEIYHATIARPPEERASFVGQECHGDESLRKQVEAMVKSHERSGILSSRRPSPSPLNF